MTETTERPLVSFAVIAYNQERFIREAIEGAFAQTYEPLEIILSDDGSPDRTFEIMQEMAVGYDGPHKVVLNRNEPNLGLVQHFNKIFELSSGDLICMNAGDDFSRIDRVDILYKTWSLYNGKHDAIHSSTYDIDELSTPIAISRPHSPILEDSLCAKIVAKEFVTAIGATFMYTKRLFEDFGKLPPCAEVEDRPMIFRAALTGGILFVDEPLVYHRHGGVSDFKREDSAYAMLFGNRIKSLSWKVSSARCYIEDLKCLPNNSVGVDKDHLIEFIRDGEWEIKASRLSYSELLKVTPEALMRTIKGRRLKPLRTHLKYVFWPFSLWFINRKLRIKKSAQST